MKRTLILAVVCLPLLLSGMAEARARRPAKRAPKPKLLFTVEKVEAQKPMPQLLPSLRAALKKALATEPLVITSLGLKKPSKARTAWELRRRRLRWYGVTARLHKVTYKVISVKKQKLLVAKAGVAVSGVRKGSRRKSSFAAMGEGKISIPVSVVLRGEVLAIRIAVTRAALADAMKKTMVLLTAPKKRRPRR